MERKLYESKVTEVEGLFELHTAETQALTKEEALKHWATLKLRQYQEEAKLPKDERPKDLDVAKQKVLDELEKKFEAEKKKVEDMYTKENFDKIDKNVASFKEDIDLILGGTIRELEIVLAEDIKEKDLELRKFIKKRKAKAGFEHADANSKQQIRAKVMAEAMTELTLPADDMAHPIYQKVRGDFDKI